MFATRFALSGCLALTFGIASAREEKPKIDKAKLVGTWTLVKTDSKQAPPNSFHLKLTLTKDGKLSAALEYDGRTQRMSGSYSVEGNRWTSAIKGPDGRVKKETVTIAELTDKKLVTIEDENGNEVTTEFKK